MIIVKNGNIRRVRYRFEATHRDRRPLNSFFTINFKYSAHSSPIHRVIRAQLFLHGLCSMVNWVTTELSQFDNMGKHQII